MSKTIYKPIFKDDEPILRLSHETEFLDLTTETNRGNLMEFIERCGKLVKPSVQVIRGVRYVYSQRYNLNIIATTYLMVYVEKIVIKQTTERSYEEIWMTVEEFYDYFHKFIMNSSKLQIYLYENLKNEANEAKTCMSYIVKKMIGSFKNEYEYKLDLKYTRSREECGWMASFLWYTNILFPKNIEETSQLIIEILGEDYEQFLIEYS